MAADVTAALGNDPHRSTPAPPRHGFIQLANPVGANGGAGALFGSLENPVSVAGFTVFNARIVTIDIIADPDRLSQPSIVSERISSSVPIAFRSSAPWACYPVILTGGFDEVAARLLHRREPAWMPDISRRLARCRRR